MKIGSLEDMVAVVVVVEEVLEEVIKEVIEEVWICDCCCCWGVGEWVWSDSGRGGAGAPMIADRNVCRGSLGSVLANVTAADSCDPSKVDASSGSEVTAADEDVVAGGGAKGEVTEPAETTADGETNAVLAPTVVAAAVSSVLTCCCCCCSLRASVVLVSISSVS